MVFQPGARGEEGLGPSGCSPHLPAPEPLGAEQPPPPAWEEPLLEAPDRPSIQHGPDRTLGRCRLLIRSRQGVAHPLHFCQLQFVVFVLQTAVIRQEPV